MEPASRVLVGCFRYRTSCHVIFVAQCRSKMSHNSDDNYKAFSLPK
jgi:hypothetical protein